jgi:putative GTP pyrophosphokinase
MTDLERKYRLRFDSTLNAVAAALEQQLRDYLAGERHIDRITARAKSIGRFLAKADASENGVRKYSEPLRQIQDQIGVRIVAFYLSDVRHVATIIERYFRPIEHRDLVPDSEWEFGYFGRHYILLVPSDAIDSSIDRSLVPDFFELQIKTLFQHAWSEANHDLGYKPGVAPLSADAKRRLAFASAQAWGADRVFEELYRERTP